MPIRKGLNFANPEESCFYQSGGVLFLPIRRGPVLTIWRGPILPIRRGPIFVNPEGYCLSRLKKTTEKKVVKGVRLLGDRLGTSDFTGNLPFTKTKPKQNRSKLGYSRH